MHVPRSVVVPKPAKGATKKPLGNGWARCRCIKKGACCGNEKPMRNQVFCAIFVLVATGIVLAASIGYTCGATTICANARFVYNGTYVVAGVTVQNDYVGYQRFSTMFYFIGLSLSLLYYFVFPIIGERLFSEQIDTDRVLTRWQFYPIVGIRAIFYGLLLVLFYGVGPDFFLVTVGGIVTGEIIGAAVYSEWDDFKTK